VPRVKAEQTDKQEHDQEVVLKQKYLGPKLSHDLTIDWDAQAKSKDGIVGLDFDPFINAQDVAERYVLGKVTPKKDSYWVEVWGYWNGKKNPKPDVEPEVMLTNGEWRFVNFHYRDEHGHYNDLISTLKSLREERKTYPAK